ncbi:Tripartite motif-containing protein 45 [Merluccius polli]|uniref:RING-type E3 ubiquitin transferase n=1 Tax=Merluccius polli TaxID=89951 RepID=A0AA47P7L6_MERPO|nr:Tripartite motif-containing protein 45 [Merluccius polli]
MSQPEGQEDDPGPRCPSAGERRSSAAEGHRVSRHAEAATCGLCGRLYRDPRILPCLHSFCADCIGQLKPLGRRSQEEDHHRATTVLCPECDTEVEIPPPGAEALSSDHLALDAVFLETLLAEGSALRCDLCGDAEARRRCEVCCVNLCEFCSQAHRRQRRTAAHSVQSVEELKAQGRLSRPVLCSLHPAQELRLFCESCDRPVCLECAATLHRDHRCCAARDVIDHHGDRIRDLVAGSLQPRLQRLEESLMKVEISEDALQARVEATADEVRAFARGYAAAVEAHCVSLLRRLEELRVQRRNQLHLQKVQLQQALSDARGGVRFAERLLTRGSDAEILSAKGVTLARLTGLVENGYDPSPATVAPDDSSSIRFLPGEGAGEVDGYPVVGVIQSKTLDLSRCTIEGEGLQVGREGQRGHFTLVCRDSAGEPLGRGGDNVLVSIVNKDKKNRTVETAVVDKGDSSYAVSYTPTEPGSYSVWVCVKAQHVKGSPFPLNVSRRLRRHAGTFHCCTFCSSGGAKDARCGCPGTMPGGFQGCGHGHKGHPGQPHWSCCGSTLEQSECRAAALSPVTLTTRGRLRTVEL